MSHFPDWLALEDRLLSLGARSEQLDAALHRLEFFQRRFRHADTYRLMDPGQLKSTRDWEDTHPVTSHLMNAEARELRPHPTRSFVEMCVHATGVLVPELIYENCERAQGRSRDEHRQLYRKVSGGALVQLFETEDYQRFADQRSGDEPCMLRLIKEAIGTRRLTRPLDNTFGCSLTRHLKRIIVVSWTTHLMAHLPGKDGSAPDEERIEATGALAENLTRRLPAYYVPAPINQLAFFTA